MARGPRLVIQNVTYHTVSRCIEKKSLMKPNLMKVLFQDILNLALNKYDFKLIDFAIMDNHFHLLIYTTKDGETISRIMQYIKSRYAEMYNRKFNRTGPFWNERYKCTIVELSDNPKQYYFLLKFYFGYNPVKKNYVKDPRDYNFSSFNVYFDKEYKPAVKISFHKYYLGLGDSFEKRRKVLLQYEKKFRHKLGL